MSIEAPGTTRLRAPEILQLPLGRLSALRPREMTDHLECGGLVMFPLAPIPLPADEDVRFLQEVTPPFHTRKNVSWYPGSGHVSGLRAPDAVTDRVRRILSEHHGRVEQLLRRIIPTFTPGWITGTSSLRAFQEKERDIPLRQRSDLIHLDAGAYGATHGHLILRFLTNLDDQDRVWRVKGTAPDIVERLGTDAGLAGQDPVSEGLFDRFVSGLIRVPSSAFPMLRTLDTSPYDRAMRRIHNRMKESVAFQSDPEGAADVHFKPRSCWMVFADMTGHACLSGKLALIDTFLIPRENFADVARTPYEILRRFGAGGAGRARTKVVVTEGASQGRAIS